MILNAIAKFLNIKEKSKETKLHFNVAFAAEKESAEGIVLFEKTTRGAAYYSKNGFYKYLSPLVYFIYQIKTPCR